MHGLPHLRRPVRLITLPAHPPLPSPSPHQPTTAPTPVHSRSRKMMRKKRKLLFASMKKCCEGTDSDPPTAGR